MMWRAMDVLATEGDVLQDALSNLASAQSCPQTPAKDIIKHSLRWSLYDEDKDKFQPHRVDKYMNCCFSKFALLC